MITSYLGAGLSLVLGVPVVAAVLALVAAAAAVVALAAALAAAAAAAPPIITSLTKLYTVEDAWREWKEGLAG
jgi:hypothetical protein